MHRVTLTVSPGAALLLALASLPLSAADWPRFRGPTGTGTSDETGLAVRWSEKEGLLWKTALPGPGSSSPVVAAGRIYVTCYSGYGVDRRDPGDPSKLERHVVCVDAKDGKILWDRTIPSKLPEVAYGGMGMPNHGYASSTPATDGERVFAFFGKTGVVAFDREGKQLWRADVSPDPQTHMFGSGASPIVWKDLVIIPAGVECEAIIAYDKQSGKEAWRAPAAGYGGWWGTGIIAGEGDAAEVIFSVPGEIWSLNPKNGKLRWHVDSFQERILCPSPVAGNGVVYAIGGRGQGSAVAVRTGGRGDATQTNVVWTKRTGSYVPSPVLVGGHLYWVSDAGIACCLKAETGDEVFRQRLEGQSGAYASLVAAEGKLYAVTRRNGTFVLDAKPEFRQIAQNVLAGDDSDFNGSPAVSDGRIFLRSDRFLYAIGKAP
jgi:outer membrane protein assembly factor BamB